MPGAEKLIKRILEEARQQADADVGRAETEAVSILEAARKDAEDNKAAILEKARKEAVEVRKRLIAVAELEARKQKLQARQEVIEEAFAQALDRLCSMPDREYQDILVNMITGALEEGNEEIILSDKDKKRVGSEFINEINMKAREKGLNASVKLADQTADIRGGFILRLGNIEINNSFEAIVRMKRDELELDIVELIL